MTIRKLLAILFFSFFTIPFAHASLGLYESKQGVIGLSVLEGRYILIAIAGGQPLGAATAGDCVIVARGVEENNKLMGVLIPFKSAYFSYDQVLSEERSIVLEMKDDAVVLEDVDTLGICGLEVSFIDIYHRVSESSGKYKDNYLELLSLARDISMSKYREKDLIGAIETAKPYAENLPLEWLNEPRQGENLSEFINNYAFFLQSAGQPEAAIKLLKNLVSLKPRRTVAWLNLADAYWDARQFNNARSCYAKYKKIMEESKKSSAVPARVHERLR